MLEVTRWARNEFGAADLRDKRRTKRVVEIAARAAERPAGQVTAVVRDEAEREAAFRFLRNPRVEAAALAKSSHDATFRRCAEWKRVLVAIDQSSLGVTDRTHGKKDFGRVGTPRDGLTRGLQAMTALAISEEGRVVGVCGQRWWSRDEKSPDIKQDQRSAEDRESSLWPGVIKDVEKGLREHGCRTRAWYQMDRGADAQHILKLASREGLLVTIRAAHDRALADEGNSRKLRETVRSKKPAGSFSLRFSAGAARRRGHSPLRPRHLAVRSCKVTLKLTDWGNHHGAVWEPAEYWVVHVRERRPPPGAERLEWFLLTTHPVLSADDALSVAQAYSLRWRVEEFHKTWKSGACNIEQSQLRKAEHFKRWATILAAVAARIEQLKYAARHDPKAPALTYATRDEVDAAIVLTPRCKWKVGAKLTIEQFVLLTANIGGYTGRSSGGPPGSIVIARGLDRVEAGATALAAVRGAEKM